MYSRRCRSIINLLYNNIKRIDLDVFTTVYIHIHTHAHIYLSINTIQMSNGKEIDSELLTLKNHVDRTK